MVVVVSLETSSSASSHRSNIVPYLYLTSMWVPLTHGAQLLAPMGVLCSGASSILGLFTDLVYLFSDFECNLAKITS